MPERTKEENLKMSTDYLQAQCTGEIEEWPGRKGPMVTAYLKHNGQATGPKGHKTVKEFAEKLLKRLKNTGFYIKFRFKVPTTNPLVHKDLLGTLISISPDGNLTFAVRERIQATFTADIEKVVRKRPILDLDDGEPELEMDVIEDDKLEV